MVGCGRCDDWFHGDCVGLDLTKVREMEEEDQMYVCLKCCEEESKKVEPEVQSTAKPEVKTEIQDHKLPPKPKPKPGPPQTLTSGGVRPVRKVSQASFLMRLFGCVLKKCTFFFKFKKDMLLCFPQLIHPLIVIIASVTTKQGFVVFLL